MLILYENIKNLYIIIFFNEKLSSLSLMLIDVSLAKIEFFILLMCSVTELTNP